MAEAGAAEGAAAGAAEGAAAAVAAVTADDVVAAATECPPGVPCRADPKPRVVPALRLPWAPPRPTGRAPLTAAEAETRLRPAPEPSRTAWRLPTVSQPDSDVGSEQPGSEAPGTDDIVSLQGKVARRKIAVQQKPIKGHDGDATFAFYM